MIALDGNRLQVSGVLTMNTVPVLYAEGIPHLNLENLVVDFAKVELVDSSAVSLLLGWLRVATKNKCDLQVTNLPDSLKSLATLYGVAEMLPAQVA
ncbi:MAG: STAS domain-containing protein [Gallionella sp.]